MTAESLFARMASTLVKEIERIIVCLGFFIPILNKQMTETSQDAEGPTGLDFIHIETEQKPQKILSS